MVQIAAGLAALNTSRPIGSQASGDTGCSRLMIGATMRLSEREAADHEAQRDAHQRRQAEAHAPRAAARTGCSSRCPGRWGRCGRTGRRTASPPASKVAAGVGKRAALHASPAPRCRPAARCRAAAAARAARRARQSNGSRARRGGAAAARWRGRRVACGGGLQRRGARPARRGTAALAAGEWKTALTMVRSFRPRSGGLDLEAVGVLRRVLAVPDHAVDQLAAAQSRPWAR